MDKSKFVELLNEDLETEFQSIVQYTTHAATIKGAEFLDVIDEMQSHLAQELEHAQKLAEQIDFLGGVPTTRVPDVPNETEAPRAIEMDLALEERQLERYRERYDQALELQLGDVASVLRTILEQTQDHVIELRTALGR